MPIKLWIKKGFLSPGQYSAPRPRQCQSSRNREKRGVSKAFPLLVVVCGWIVLLAATATTQSLPGYKYIDPNTGYRLGHYRAPTPESVPGAKRITLSDLKQLRGQPNVTLVDVMAHTGAGPDPLSGEWRVSEVRMNIPGSVWLPEVGQGRLSPLLSRYFRENLEMITGGDKKHVLVVYCIADCWASWNAAKRAGEWGYENVLWFAEGTDDWSQAGLPLEEGHPVRIKLK